MSTLRWLKSYFALIVIAGAFLWSAWSILSLRIEQEPAGAKIIHIAHWQLEAGVRTGLNALAAEYVKLHPDVRIVQDAIPETVYPTWITTNLLGGTAPDLIEIGKLSADLQIAYFNRYFLPLTRYVNAPNPYARGTDLENVALRQTYKDGMKSAYVAELQEYMQFTLTQFGVRVFYNKTLLRELTGSDAAPKNWQEFKAACEKIMTQRDRNGRVYAPIASTLAYSWAWNDMMLSPITYPLLRSADFNRDHEVGVEEFFVAVLSGAIDFKHPSIAALYRMQNELIRYYPVGYTGLGRDDAGFHFTQQRSVFLATGTWDAQSLLSQAEGLFEIGIMDFPRPARDDPDYGEVYEGPIYELPGNGFGFGVTRTSKHSDVAVDFLCFLASRERNEELNRHINWIPAIDGAKTSAFLSEFEPHLEGIKGALNPNLGPETRNRWSQLEPLFLLGLVDFDQLMDQFGAFYKTKGIDDFRERVRDWRRAARTNEESLAAVRAAALLSTGDDSKERWGKYRGAVAMQVATNIMQTRMIQLVENAQSAYAKPAPPYQYSSEVVERVRQRLRAERGR